MKPLVATLLCVVAVAAVAACSEKEPEQLPAADAGAHVGCLDGRTGAEGACKDAGADAADGG
ncbi:MAG: hypothetical protein IT374_20850 [Polyangiaceae bacterium]|nr:hypothetical protein [Polyangiaceae bacterium]